MKKKVRIDGGGIKAWNDNDLEKQIPTKSYCDFISSQNGKKNYWVDKNRKE